MNHSDDNTIEHPADNDRETIEPGPWDAESTDAAEGVEGEDTAAEGAEGEDTATEEAAAEAVEGAGGALEAVEDTAGAEVAAPETGEAAPASADTWEGILPEITPEERAPRVWLRWLLGIIAVAALCAGAWALGRYGLPWDRSKTEVPDVVGRTQAAATKMFADADLKIDVVRRVRDSEVPSGSIVAQEPAPGVETTVGAGVTLVVSRGRGVRSIPNLTGMAASDATSALSAEGFAFVAVRAYSETATADKVFSQLPAAGVDAPMGSVVSVMVSAGKAAVVPDVVGDAETAATGSVTRKGLKVEVVRMFDQNVASGRVTAMVPAPGATIEPTASVVLVVSKGSSGTTPTVTVPDLAGKTPKDAEAALKAKGLKPESVRAYSPNADAGRVAMQYPSVGTTVTSGASVAFLVSTARVARVPDVTGISQESAQNACQGAGLASQVVTISVSWVPAGNTVAQMPPAGAAVRTGETVTLIVAVTPANLEAPNLVGMSEADAVSAIESMGLNTAIRYVDGKKAGTVAAQRPVARSVVLLDQTITIEVGRSRPATK